MGPHLNPTRCISAVVFCLGQVAQPCYACSGPSSRPQPFHVIHFWIYSLTLESKSKAMSDSKKGFLTGHCFGHIFLALSDKEYKVWKTG